MTSEVKTQTLRSFILTKLNDGKIHSYFDQNIGSSTKESFRELLKKIRVIAKDRKDDVLVKFFDDELESTKGWGFYIPGFFDGQGWPEMKKGPDVETKSVETMNQIEKEYEKAVDDYETRRKTKPNLRMYLVDKVSNGPIFDLCRSSRNGTSPIDSLLSDLIDVAKEAGDDELGTFFDKCSESTSSTKECILFEESRWPNLLSGADLDMDCVSPIVELEKTQVKMAAFLSTLDSDILDRYFGL
jgi:hypothetical protein